MDVATETTTFYEVNIIKLNILICFGPLFSILTLKGDR